MRVLVRCNSDSEQGSPAQTEQLVPAISAPDHRMPSIESVILHKLLAELEAREATRTARPFMVEQQRRRTLSNRRLWSSLWALSILLCVFVVKFFDNRQLARTVDTAQARSINNLSAAVAMQKTEFSKLIASVQGMAGVIASTSARTAAIPGMLQRLTSDLKQTAALPATTLPVREASEAAPARLPAIMMLPSQPSPAGVSIGGHHHAAMENSVAPIDVVVHHNNLGVMDYWLMPRVVSGVWTTSKVVPIGENARGILVHDVSEVKDYLVTPSREWIAISETTAPATEAHQNSLLTRER